MTEMALHFPTQVPKPEVQVELDRFIDYYLFAKRKRPEVVQLSNRQFLDCFEYSEHQLQSNDTLRYRGVRVIPKDT